MVRFLSGSRAGLVGREAMPAIEMDFFRRAWA